MLKVKQDKKIKNLLKRLSTQGSCFTFFRLVPHDALQVNAGSWLAGSQIRCVVLQQDASILRVGADGPRPHRQLLRAGVGHGRRGEGLSWGQGGPGGPGLAGSRGRWHCEHGVHLERRRRIWLCQFWNQLYDVSVVISVEGGIMMKWKGINSLTFLLCVLSVFHKSKSKIILVLGRLWMILTSRCHGY